MNHRALYLAVASSFAFTAAAEKTEPPNPQATVAAAVADAKAPIHVAQAPSAKAPAKAKARKKKQCQKGRPCDVLVKVSDCKVSLDYDDVEVHKNRVDEFIDWKITSAGYSWTGTGVRWDDPNASGPKGQFYDKKVKGKTLSWKDRNTDTVTYKYWVEVQDKDKKACPPFDPTVINGVVVVTPVDPAGSKPPGR